MTESMFPFPADSAGSDSGNRRKMLLVALAGVVVVALLGMFVVLPALAGGGTPANQSAAVATAPRKPAKKPAAKKPAARRPAATTTFTDSVVRDPFLPLYRVPVAAIAGPVGFGPGTAPGAGTPVTAAPPVATAPGSSTSVGGQRVALVRVFAQNGKQYAQTRVGDRVYTPAVGEAFGGMYKLLATSGRSATYLYGDEQFSLSEGQEVLK